MKKLNVIFVILIFAVSLLVSGCSASGKVAIDKQQNVNTVKLVK